MGCASSGGGLLRKWLARSLLLQGWVLNMAFNYWLVVGFQCFVAAFIVTSDLLTLPAHPKVSNSKGDPVVKMPALPYH